MSPNYGKGGIVVFDSDKRTVLTKDNSPLLSDNVSGLDFGPDGDLWIVFKRLAVARVHQGRWQFFGKELFVKRPNAPFDGYRVTAAAKRNDLDLGTRALSYAAATRPESNCQGPSTDADKVRNHTRNDCSQSLQDNCRQDERAPWHGQSSLSAPRSQEDHQLATDRTTRSPDSGGRGIRRRAIAGSCFGTHLHAISQVVGSRLGQIQASKDSTRGGPIDFSAWRSPPAGDRLAVGTGLKLLTVFDTQSGEIAYELELQTELNELAYSPDGKWLACGSGGKFGQDGRVVLHTAATGEIVKTFAAGEKPRRVQAVAFSPNGQFVAAGSDDKLVRLWDLESGEVTRTLTGHGSGIRGLAFAPDGTWLTFRRLGLIPFASGMSKRGGSRRVCERTATPFA